MQPSNFTGFFEVETNLQTNLIEDLLRRSEALRGYLDYAQKRDRLEEVSRELENPEIWNQPELAQELGRERSRLETVVSTLDELEHGLSDAREMLDMAVEEEDAEIVDAVSSDLALMQEKVERLEFQRMFAGEMDANPCFIDIQSGSGGTEAQDWAEMLLRMYLRWAERRGWKYDLVEVSTGDVAGIKSATIHITGDYAYGWCRTETGVHRLVRKSPFDSGNRRHTSFAAVFVSPEVDDNIEIDINPADIRVDVYRASGAGGQHVNTTDSAVRMTHVPTGIVVQCQNDRSQHKNRDHAMKQLRARLYEHEMQKRTEAHQKLEDSKSDIGWGSQIRSYVLDQSRIKDLRTGVEVGNTQGVLDGDLDPFVEASLKQGL
ncbi:MAG: peptide chain release factor 2 [Xanthomonadales bacterium]|nr:peptide chain release factor 2 [Xanthomonadales bacterium]MDH3925680.1 peptide chain release factor 2 [Xanthomonadales bacterium]MDH4000236.1 peptide chain release factor 2 [Xanthomonadales bacterium]